MNNRYSIQGDVNNRGSNILSADRTFKDILLKEAGGMIENRRVKMIQIGGPLGKCINNEEINLTIGQLEGDAMTKDIYYFSNLLCPVDYLRFIT
jgi:NADH:ubiquinone oxidoreductase subunit F (NADH-binding)